MSFFNIQNSPLRPDVQELPTVDSNRQMEVLDDDFPPDFIDLIDKEVNDAEDDESLPCYEVACEKDAQGDPSVFRSVSLSIRLANISPVVFV